MKQHSARFPSPIGDLQIICTPEALLGIHFEENFTDVPMGDSALIRRVKRELQEYFKGKRKEFNLPLDMKGTPFQWEVWQALIRIPFGLTVTYGDLAKQIGRPKAVRAVGMANARNPIPIIVPCHRVIGNTGKLVGYAGGLWRKEWLLQHEHFLLI